MSEPTSERGDAGPRTPAERQLAERADPRTNTLVQAVLRVGLGIALVLLLAGLVIQLANGQHEAFSVKMFDLWAPRPIGERVMAVGALILAITPVAGVLSVVGSWVAERDRRFVGVGLIVVAVLSAAVVVGLG